MSPWHRLEDPAFPGLTYRDGAGLPSGVIPACAYRCFDWLKVDNDFSHISSTFVERIQQVFQATVNVGRGGFPEGRPVVERFFETLEERGFHRLASTTGSHPKDPRRQAAEKAAKKDKFTFEVMMGILDVLLANYNASQHSGIFHQTPLERIQHYLDEDVQLIRHIPQDEREPSRLGIMVFVCTVRGSVAKGTAPYIQFKNARYSNNLIRDRPDLVGEKVYFEVNRHNIITANIRLVATGKHLGTVAAGGVWGERPHSLKTRNDINQLASQGKLDWRDSDPITAYHEFLASNPHSSRNVSLLLDLQKRQLLAGEEDPLSYRPQQRNNSTGVSLPHGISPPISLKNIGRRKQ